MLIKYYVKLGPWANLRYCRNETDLMPDSGGSDFLARSTVPFILIEKWILCLVKFQTLLSQKGMPCGGARRHVFS